MPKKIQVKISGQNGWKPAIIAVVTDGEWSFDSQPEVEDIKMVDESECEHDGEIKSYICQKCGEDVRDSNKIEKLEISNNAVRDSFNYIMRETHEKINEIIDHLEAENEIDKIWDEIKDIKAVMRNHHIGHPSNGGSMGGDMCRAYGTNGEERGRK